MRFQPDGRAIHSRTFGECDRVHGTRYRMLQEKNGGQTRAGRQLGQWLETGGLVTQKVQARYECYPESRLIAEYLAIQLEHAGQSEFGVVLREWAALPWSLFAQSWVSAIAVKG